MTYHSPGALHIHSVFSDGSGDLAEIARDARRAGLEWIGMTDHNTLVPSYRGFEGIHDGVAVIVGYEWTPDGGDHMLVYGGASALGDEPVDPTLPPADAIGILDARGALTHVAHPDERRGVAIPELAPYPWHDWSVRGMRGIELWNYMSVWAERLTPRNRLLHGLLPSTGLGGPTDRVLRWWDELNEPLPAAGEPGSPTAGEPGSPAARQPGASAADETGSPTPEAGPPRRSRGRRARKATGPGPFAGGSRLTVGVSGTDAHAFRVRAFRRTFTIFPYVQLFRAFTNYLRLPGPLPGDIDGARSAILSAIAEGRLYFANRRLGDALGLDLVAHGPAGASAGPGEWLPWTGAAELRAVSPRPADLRILRNGEELARGRGRELCIDVRLPGTYRLEARRFGEPWAFTNPVVIGPGGG